jgi:sugar/nucleoside kinase (ribokinase family)
MRKYDLCGLGNALVDLLFECSEEEFSKLNMQKGGMRLIDANTQTQLLKDLGTHLGKTSGGSVANSIALFSQLGGRAALVCALAQDDFGRFFKTDLANIGVDVYSAQSSGEEMHSGTSVVVVTPDAERSMSTCLAASSTLASEHIDEKVLSDSTWLFIEGYLIANSDAAREAVMLAVQKAKQVGTKVAITLSDAFVVNGFYEFIKKLLPQVDLIFCNHLEAQALVKNSGVDALDDAERNFDILSAKYPGILVTAGAAGAFIKFQDHQGHVAAYACDPVDLTGAGDAFAGGFIHGICSGQSPFDSAKKGCLYASKVIQQWGARLREVSK